MRPFALRWLLLALLTAQAEWQQLIFHEQDLALRRCISKTQALLLHSASRDIAHEVFL